VKDIVNLYKKHRGTLENFVMTIIENNSLDCNDKPHTKAAFEAIGALRGIYHVNLELEQITPTYYRKSKDESRIGQNKKRYFSNITLNDHRMFISSPYIHHKTGASSITVVRRVENKYIVFDFDLFKLLEEIKLIEHNTKFDKFNRFVYAIGGYSLSIVSIFLLLYGLYIFLQVFMMADDMYVLHEIFKSIISITLGLAIYDLAKTIIAHEVVFKGIGLESNNQYKILGKFLSSIIIALSIESLMVVFKIALDDISSISNASYLIFSVTFMIVGLGVFYHLTTKSKN
jgi:hypothetical protein